MKTNSAITGFIRFAFLTGTAVVLCTAGALMVHRYTLWISRSQTFLIQKIGVNGNDLVSEKEILRLGEIPERGNIWRVNLRESEKKIEANPFIRNAVVSRHFPNAVSIRIEEKKPIVLLNAGGMFYSIDQNGILLPAKSGKLYELPIVSSRLPGSIRTGQSVGDPSVIQCLDFIRLVLVKRSELYAEVSEMVYSASEGLTVYTRRKGVPVHLGRDGYERKIRYLEAFLSEWSRNPNRSSIDYLDLRFEGQVVLGIGA